jgi:hypothetical protein
VILDVPPSRGGIRGGATQSDEAMQGAGMGEANAGLGYRLVQRSVRPPRAVTLVCSGGDWRADVLRMVECYARTWGGDGHGLIACTPAWEIAEPFWRLVEAFDADH